MVGRDYWDVQQVTWCDWKVATIYSICSIVTIMVYWTTIRYQEKYWKYWFSIRFSVWFSITAGFTACCLELVSIRQRRYIVSFFYFQLWKISIYRYFYLHWFMDQIQRFKSFLLICMWPPGVLALKKRQLTRCHWRGNKSNFRKATSIEFFPLFFRRLFFFLFRLSETKPVIRNKTPKTHQSFFVSFIEVDLAWLNFSFCSLCWTTSQRIAAFNTKSEE